MQDTGHILSNNFGCGSERRKILDEKIHSGERSFRDVSEEMWGSLDMPFDDGFAVMKDALDIDSEFQTFQKFCLNNKILFNVISAGLKPVLRRVLDHVLGEEASSNIEIVANDATISSDGSKWKPVWLHDTEPGHDKAESINGYREHAKLESNDGTILFTHRGLCLEEYCIEHKLPYIPFNTFADIQREVIKIAKIDKEKIKGQGLPSNFNPRVNLWRRVSSKNAVPIFATLTPLDKKMFVWPDISIQHKTPMDGSALTVPAA